MNIPRLRPGWVSVVCLAPMCTKRARTKVGACLTPGHRGWVIRAQMHQDGTAACDKALFGDRCSVCEQIQEQVGH